MPKTHDMHKVARILSRIGSIVPLVLLAATLAVVALAQPTKFSDLAGACTSEMREVVGSPCWSIPAPVVGADAALTEAAEIAALTEGMECWPASEGRLGSHVVVRSEVGVLLLPLDESTWAAAGRGEFQTLHACA